MKKPNKIIEVGSDYSTVGAKTTVENIGLDCEIHAVDPQPCRSIENIDDQIEYKSVENSSLAEALLACSEKFEIVFATHYLPREHEEAMQAVSWPKIANDPLFYGASFWVKSCVWSFEMPFSLPVFGPYS